jgi:hypothetical protein
MLQILKHDPRIEVIVVDDNLPGGTGRLADAPAIADPVHTPCNGPACAGTRRSTRSGTQAE